MVGWIDHEDLEKGIGQIVVAGVVDMVERLACGPEGRCGEQGRLHETACGLFGIVERALQGGAVDWRHGLQNLGPLLPVEILQNGDGVVALEVAHALGHGLRGQFVENVLANIVVDLDQRSKVEFSPHKLDKAGTVLVIQRLDQVADIGLVQMADQLEQPCGVVAGDGLGHRLHEGAVEVALFIAQADGVGRRVFGGDVGHGVPVQREGLVLLTCGALRWQSPLRVLEDRG